jgi:predicted helicase
MLKIKNYNSMSTHSVKQYQSEVEKIVQFSGTRKETAIRVAFFNLLNEYAKQKGLMMNTEVSIKGTKGKIVRPDGTLRDSLMQDCGHWENIDEDIEKKFTEGYPKDNIIFEDSNTAVLIQGGNERMRVSMNDAEALDRIIKEFIAYQRPEVENFHKAIELFKQDIPMVTDTLRGIILAEEKTNEKFKEAEATFWELCQESVNPEITLEDVREMMIQHILTEDIFNTIFDETQFHRENNIARELEQVILTFFNENIKRVTLGAIQHYYKAINTAAAQIADHHEKQKFLKVVYEIFYKGYNPKAADRLGVVYTPNEIVKFMIESTDYLLQHHFGKGLEDQGVEIIDPATGTGTFICDIIDYLPKAKLPYKYQHEIHANEIAILPYYIANLNIEYTYKQKLGEYKEFENLCFVDTLDNLGFDFKRKQQTLFDASAGNTQPIKQQIKRQNENKISVVIGNPPYNANQMNENDNNKNRTYPILDKRIKDSFIKHSTAQKTKVYDIYARFYRWAIDKLEDNGIVAFITNRSFIDSRSFDGFRKVMSSEFNRIYIVDLGGDVRTNPKLSGTKHNVFGIQTGVAIAFMVKMNNTIDAKSRKEFKQLESEYDIAEEPIISKIGYYRRPEFETSSEKLDFLGKIKFIDVPFETVTPDKNNNWINIGDDNDWDELLPLNKVFNKSFNGVVTNRDEWVYDFDRERLLDKVKYFATYFNNKALGYSSEVKWSETLKRRYESGIKHSVNKQKIIEIAFRAYVKKQYYNESTFSDRLTNNHFETYGNDLNSSNLTINTYSINSSHELSTLASNCLIDLCFLKQGNGGTFSIPFECIDKQGNRLDNLTDWGLQQFQTNYNDQSITKENIFHYVYAVLHNPAYRKKYELNLKRDFPRIPFYENFGKWSAWGKALMELHIDYETVKPYPLSETGLKDEQDENAKSCKSQNQGSDNLKPKLKADKETGTIELDEATTLSGVPPEAWLYKLGNRSALEWVLDQYKEKKPTDPTIAEKFNTYRFADYKPQVIDLLKRVCTVSVETMKIVGEMEKSQ